MIPLLQDLSMKTNSKGKSFYNSFYEAFTGTSHTASPFHPSLFKRGWAEGVKEV